MASSCLGAAGGALEVGDHVGIRLVHGRRPVPGAPVRIIGMTQGIGQGGVHVAAVDARGGGVHGGPDERVPQLDLAPGDLHEAGALRLGQGVRAGARGGRGTLHGGELHQVVRGSHEQQLLRTWREPSGSVEEDPLDGGGDRKLPGQARPAGQLVRRERLRHLHESERVAPGACQELSGHRRAHV